MSRVEDRIRSCGLQLPEVRVNSRVAPAVRAGALVFVSGFSSTIRGRVGADVDVPRATHAAREAMLACIAEARTVVPNLDRIRHVVKLLGFVQSTEAFMDHPEVLHGASDLVLELFGWEVGRHARSAIGTSALDGGATVEIEAIFEIRRPLAMFVRGRNA